MSFHPNLPILQLFFCHAPGTDVCVCPCVITQVTSFTASCLCLCLPFSKPLCTQASHVNSAQGKVTRRP
jgi:hypothetical protein